MNSLNDLRVSDVMTLEPYTIDGLATVSEAVSMMRKHGVNSIVVNRRNEQDEPGLVAVSDIAREVINQDRSPDRVNVYEIMTKPAMTVTADMKARYAVRLLIRFDIAQAVVLDAGGNPTGTVSLRDLVLGFVG